MKTYYRDFEMKDVDEFEYDMIMENDDEKENSFIMWNPCFSILELIGKYCCSEYGKSVRFTTTIHNLLKQTQNNNIVFIDDLVHGNMKITEIEHIVKENRKKDFHHFILCFRLGGKFVDHIVVVTFDFQKNKLSYFDSKGINPFGDIRIIRGLFDDDNRQLRPVNLCSTIKSILSKENKIAPIFVYNTDKVQSWWDFWSCGIHSLIYIEKDILYDSVM